MFTPPTHVCAILLDGRREAWLMRWFVACVMVAMMGWIGNCAWGTSPEGADSPVASSSDWPLFRGDSAARGVATTELATSLELLWTYKVEKGAFEATPVAAWQRVYIPDLDGTLHAIQLEDGKLAFQKKMAGTDGIGTGFIASPSVQGKRLYLADMDGKVYCLSADNGEEEWSFPTEAEIDGAVNFYQDRVLVGSQDATLYCLTADKGKLVWKFTTADQIRCSPTISHQSSFVAGCDQHLHVIDLDQGTETLKVPIDDPTGVTPAALGDRVFFGTEGGNLFCVDWRKGSVVWQVRGNSQRQPYRGSPAVTEKVVVVAGRDKRVRALRTDTGEELWNYTTKARIDASPLIVGERVFVAGGDGRVLALQLADGAVAWQYEAGGKFTASPIAVQGKLIVANDEGTVFCFGTPQSPTP